MATERGHKDVLIKAPTAVWPQPKPGKTFELPSPQEIIQMQAQLLKQHEAQIEELKIACSTMANVGMGMAYLMCQEGYAVEPDTIAIPKHVSDLMEGSKMTVGQDADGNVLVKFNFRQPNFVEPDKGV